MSAQKSYNLQDSGVLRFPEGFVWGAATAAYQIEGAAGEDGRGPSIWDTFCRTPGKVHAGTPATSPATTTTAIPKTSRSWRDLGLHAYRFSISWPRIQPDGAGPANPRGLDFYDRLVDELLGSGIDPDRHALPLGPAAGPGGPGRLDQPGHRRALRRVRRVVYARLGDRVDTWTTLNEPWCSAFLGYANGHPRAGPYRAGAALRRRAPPAARPRPGGRRRCARRARARSASRSTSPRSPGDPRRPPRRARPAWTACRTGSSWTRCCAASTPPTCWRRGRRFSRLAFVEDGDLEIISQPIDLLGMNYYHPQIVAGRARRARQPGLPGQRGDRVPRRRRPVTAMGWPIHPSGLTDLLVRLSPATIPAPR